MLRKHLNLNKKAISLLLCVISAFSLWVYVSYVENPEITRTIRHVPVVIEGEDVLNKNGLAIKDATVDNIDLNLKTKRSNYRQLSPETINAAINVASLSSTGKHKLNVSVSFPASASGVSITNKSVDVELEVEKYITQAFDVTPRYSDDPPSGYCVHEITMDGGSFVVHVSGGESAVKSVKKVVTSMIDLSGVTGNVQKAVTFKAVNSDGESVKNVKLSIDSSIMADFEIYRTASFPLELSIISNSEDIESTAELDQVQITGPADIITQWVDQNKKIYTKPFSEHTYRNEDHTSIELQELPEGFEYKDKIKSVKVNFKNLSPSPNNER